MKPKFCACCIFLLVVVSSSIAQQRPQVPRVTGFFSDMSYIPEAGDVVGTEVWIVYARGGYYASVQIAEGEPDPPYLVPVEVTGLTEVKFTISQPLKSGRKAGPPTVIEFKGTVSNAGLMLSAPERTLLKRRSSYWQ